MDIAKCNFAELVHHSSHKVIGLISQPSSIKPAETGVLLYQFMNLSWAFVFHAFMEGEETDKKFTPQKVVLMMRNLKHTDYGKFFKPEPEFLRAQKRQTPNTCEKEQCHIHAESNDY